MNVLRLLSKKYIAFIAFLLQLLSNYYNYCIFMAIIAILLHFYFQCTKSNISEDPLV